jgi:hypothetical protein
LPATQLPLRDHFEPGPLEVERPDAAATRLLKDPTVQKRMSEFQQKAELETALTLEEHMRELELLREMAKSEGRPK